MIGLKDIEKIVISGLREIFPIERIYIPDDMPEGLVTEERIVVRVGRTSVETYFNKNFVQVNWCVPDIEERADSLGLEKAERQLSAFESVGEYDGTAYRYEADSTEILKSELGCHYVNVRLLFEILNVRQNG